MTIAPAGLGGWVRFVHAEHVWGTVVTFDVRGPEDPCADEGFVGEAREAVSETVDFLHDVDAWFSTYRVDSSITALRNGLLALDEMPAVVRSVLDGCRHARVLTRAVFDPWAVPGGVDPSGYVKGWAADVAADILVHRGFPNVSVNAAGDVSCRGLQSPGHGWTVGIRHPVHPGQIIRTCVAFDEAVATSGRYEQGEHVLDPRTHRFTAALDSATVVGPDGGLADALATALLIVGAEGAAWFADLEGWSAYLVAGSEATYFGPAFIP
ncbi:MAG: FAD:protein FMN transferase [Actinomycetes bacterium]